MRGSGILAPGTQGRIVAPGAQGRIVAPGPQGRLADLAGGRVRQLSRNSTAVGHLNRARLRSQWASSSSTVTGAVTTTNALTVCPVYGCGAPSTAASATAGCAGEHLLDLVRVDVEAADQDQLAQPVDQEQVAVGVGVGHVAGRPPAVGVGPVPAVRPVAAEQVGAADHDLARVAAG